MSQNLQVSYSALGMSDDNQTSLSMPSVASSSRAARNVNFHGEINETTGGGVGGGGGGGLAYPIPLQPARRFSKSFFQRPRSMSVWSDISRSSMRLDERFALVGPWIPLKERSRFMSSFQGFNIGIGLTYSFSGLIIQNYGWGHVFLTTGSMGMIWCVVWYFLAFNTPRQHPRITEKELKYIEENTEQSKASKRVPWIAIFTSLPVWCIAITTFGRIWIACIFVVSGPNFIKSILEFEYLANGFVSGMPFICSYFSSLVFCFVADKMVLRFSLTFVRKFFTMISQIIPSVLLVSVAYTDNVPLLLVLWYLAVMCITAAYAGAMANIVDIAPNFSGPVLAFSQSIHMSASFLSPLVVGFIVTRSNSLEQWRLVFIQAAIVASVTYLAYQFGGTAEVQKWNATDSNNV